MTKTVLLRKLHCPIDDECPSLERVEREDGVTRIRVTGEDPADPTTEIQLDADPALFPGLLSLEITDWPGWLAAHRKTPGDLLRVQTLSQYGSSADGSDYQRYLHGADLPRSEAREAWFAKLEREAAAGQVRRNLHVITDMTDYLRYAFEWGYAYNVRHGQQVRVLDTREHPAAAALVRTGDYWVVEGQHVVQCRYNEQGTQTGLVQVEASGSQGFVTAAEMGWALGTDFATWWDAHPQHHRPSLAA